MARIPTYTRQLSLTKEAPAATTNASAAGMAARSVGDVGEALFKFGEKIKQIRVEDEVNQAMISSRQSLNQVKLDASSDNDLNGYLDKYNAQLSKVRSEALSKIKDKDAVREFDKRFGLDIVDSQFSINQLYHQKSIDSAKATLNNSLAQMQEEYIQSTDPLSKQKKFDEISFALSQAANNGLMTRVDASKSLENIKSQLPKAQVQWDIYNDQSTQEEDSQVLAMLKNKKSYPELTSEARLDLIKESQQRIYNNNQKFKRDTENAMFNGRSDTITKILDGTINDTNFASYRDQVSTYDPELAGAMQNVFSSKARYEVQTSNQNFSDLADSILKAEDKKSLNNFILQVSKDKKLNQDQLGVLVDTARQRANELDTNKPGFIKQAFDAIKHASPLYNAYIFLRTMNRVRQEGIQGKDILKVANEEIVNQAISTNVNLSNTPKEGKEMVDKLGNRAIVYPDGSYKIIEQKEAK